MGFATRVGAKRFFLLHKSRKEKPKTPILVVAMCGAVGSQRPFWSEEWAGFGSVTGASLAPTLGELVPTTSITWVEASRSLDRRRNKQRKPIILFSGVFLCFSCFSSYVFCAFLRKMDGSTHLAMSLDRFRPSPWSVSRICENM